MVAAALGFVLAGALVLLADREARRQYLRDLVDEQQLQLRNLRDRMERRAGKVDRRAAILRSRHETLQEIHDQASALWTPAGDEIARLVEEELPWLERERVEEVAP